MFPLHTQQNTFLFSLVCSHIYSKGDTLLYSNGIYTLKGIGTHTHTHVHTHTHTHTHARSSLHQTPQDEEDAADDERLIFNSLVAEKEDGSRSK